MNQERDQLRRFLFDRLPVHGRLVRLNATLQAVLENQPYPAPVSAQLGQAMVAAALLAATLKFRGQLTLQLQGQGPLKLMVVQCSDGLTMRAVAHYDASIGEGSLRSLAGNGTLAVTLETGQGGQRYQGIVPLVGESMADCLDAYFRTSEQLPTRFWLASGPYTAAGMLLQQLPSSMSASDEDAWPRVSMLAQTLTPEELLGLPDRELLVRLFHEEDLRLMESRRVTFGCQCTRGRVEDVLRSLGEAELRGVLAERGDVEVLCEFCNKPYRFDEVDVARVLADSPGPGSPSVH